MSLLYSMERSITVEQFRSLLERSGLAERRPVDDEACLQSMLENANLMITAWQDDQLVGIARSVTDFSYCCYLSDLAVDRAVQSQGVGRELMNRTQAQLGEHCLLILLAAPAADEYYAKVGFERHPRCWTLERHATLE